MGWFVLTAGLPHYGMSEPGDPGPFTFLNALVTELTDFAPEDLDWVVDDERTENYRWRTWSHCGSEAQGIRSLREGPDDTNAFIDETFTSVGLPGTDLRWAVGWTKSGYGYRLGRGRLLVEFAGADAEARFCGVWQQVFGQRPVLTAHPGPQET